LPALWRGSAQSGISSREQATANTRAELRAPARRHRRHGGRQELRRRGAHGLAGRSKLGRSTCWSTTRLSVEHLPALRGDTGLVARAGRSTWTSVFFSQVVGRSMVRGAKGYRQHRSISGSSSTGPVAAAYKRLRPVHQLTLAGREWAVRIRVNALALGYLSTDMSPCPRSGTRQRW